MSKLVGLVVAGAGATSALVNKDLCAVWEQLDTGTKCGPGQTCLDDSTSFVSLDSLTFASDGSFTRGKLISTGGCDGLMPGVSTIVFSANTIGDYNVVDEVDAEGFNKLAFVPDSFEVHFSYSLLCSSLFWSSLSP